MKALLGNKRQAEREANECFVELVSHKSFFFSKRCSQIPMGPRARGGETNKLQPPGLSCSWWPWGNEQPGAPPLLLGYICLEKSKNPMGVQSSPNSAQHQEQIRGSETQSENPHRVKQSAPNPYCCYRVVWEKSNCVLFM